MPTLQALVRPRSAPHTATIYPTGTINPNKGPGGRGWISVSEMVRQDNTNNWGPAQGRHDRMLRHLAWLEQREQGRAQAREQILAAIRQAMDGLEQCTELAGPNQDLQAQLDQAMDQLNRAMYLLRGENSPLGSAPLCPHDLRNGLAELAAAAESATMGAVDARIDDAVRHCVAPAKTGHVLAVVREALANAVRHASASRLALRATVERKRLVVTISDDGQGFDPWARRPEHHQGIARMQARAEAAGGLLQVESARGAGTIVTLTVPVKHQ